MKKKADQSFDSMDADSIYKTKYYQVYGKGNMSGFLWHVLLKRTFFIKKKQVVTPCRKFFMGSVYRRDNNI